MSMALPSRFSVFHRYHGRHRQQRAPRTQRLHGFSCINTCCRSTRISAAFVVLWAMCVLTASKRVANGRSNGRWTLSRPHDLDEQISDTFASAAITRLNGAAFCNSWAVRIGAAVCWWAPVLWWAEHIWGHKGTDALFSHNGCLSTENQTKDEY